MIETDTLPDNLEELKALILDKDERIAARDEHITILEEKIRVLKKAIFGSRSERRHLDDEGSKQLHLFNEAEVLAEPEVPRKLVVPEHTRNKPKRKPLPPELPRVEIIEDVDDSEKICCGVEMTRIGEEICEKLDYVPARLRVIRSIRLKYACGICEGVETEGPTVKIAPPPVHIIPKGIATPGLVAHIAVSKYADALPLYRQEKIFSRYGIELSRSTMAEWMVKAAGCCTPLMDLLYKELLVGPLINVDETPLQVLNEPERANTTKSYMWVFRGGRRDKPVILFKYSETRSGAVPREVLAGYRGYCQTDGFSGYDGLEASNPDIRLVGCFFHARRNFVKVIDARGKAAKHKPGSAEVALDYIGQLYKVEKTAKQRGLSAEDIVAFRKENAIPVLEKFKTWMDKRIDQTPPKGLLGQALNYAITRWDKLIRYTENGFITPDNNMVENDIRNLAVGRKNWLFAGHPNGAHASATLHSLIVTARACGLDPYQYLRFLFSKIPCARTEDDYRALMPPNLTSEILSRFLSSETFI